MPVVKRKLTELSSTVQYTVNRIEITPPTSDTPWAGSPPAQQSHSAPASYQSAVTAHSCEIASRPCSDPVT